VTAAAASAPRAAKPLSKRRRFAIWALIVVASILAVVTVLTLWINRQVLDNDNWRQTSADLIADPAVQNTLSVYLVDQLYDNVDVAGAFEEQLPENLKGLAAPLAGALRQPATRTVNRLLTSPRLQQAFVNSSAAAHQKLVNVLENKTGNGIDTGSGNVTLDLHQLLTELATTVGLPPDAVAKLPATAGTVTIMSSDQLSLAQTGVQIIRVLSVWLFILVLVLYAVAIYLAHGRRRETLRNIGFAFLLVGLLVLVVRELAGNYVIGGLTDSPSLDRTGHHVWIISTSILGDIGWAVVLYGAVAVVGALFAGPTTYAVRLRRWMAPVMNDRPAVVWGVTAVAYLLLILWGGTHALRTAWGILLLGGLLALGVFALRRESLLEFPDASIANDDSVQAHVVRSPAAEIAQLRELRDSGAITDAEFERGKQLALSRD
jgi:Short C-terminal domain